MMYSKSQSSGSNVIPRRARPGPAGLRPHTTTNPALAVLYVPYSLDSGVLSCASDTPGEAAVDFATFPPCVPPYRWRAFLEPPPLSNAETHPVENKVL